MFDRVLDLPLEMIWTLKSKEISEYWHSLTVEAEVLPGFILGPSFFLIYINDLSHNLISRSKLFADHTSLFSQVHDISTSTEQVNEDLQKNIKLGI